MTRFVNAVLILVLATFVSLALVGVVDSWKAGRASPHGSGPDGPTAVVQSVAWQTGATSTPLAIGLRLSNPGPGEVRLAGVQLEARLNGQPLDVERSLAGAAPAGGSTDVTIDVPVPMSAIDQWWDDYAAADEHGRLSITGNLTAVVRQADKPAADVVLPFNWSRSWTGHLAEGLVGLESCPADAEVCLAVADVVWSGGDLTLRLRVEAENATIARNGSVALRLAGATVASTTLPDFSLEDGGATRDVRLVTADDGLSAWWPRHVEACESSSASLVVHLDVDERHRVGNSTVTVPSSLDWILPMSAPFATSFACPAEA